MSFMIYLTEYLLRKRENTMDYTEALKKVMAVKPKGNFFSIQTSYDVKLILPYKDGMAYMGALENAEQLDEPYNKQHRIKEFDRKSITATIMSYDEYVRYKIAALLGIKPEEVNPEALTPQ